MFRSDLVPGQETGSISLGGPMGHGQADSCSRRVHGSFLRAFDSASARSSGSTSFPQAARHSHDLHPRWQAIPGHRRRRGGHDTVLLHGLAFIQEFLLKNPPPQRQASQME